MRLIIQRVNSARVKVNQEIVGEIGEGIFVLMGIGKEDTEANADYLAKKLVSLRIMKDENQRMNRSVIDTKGQILLVSQFTLYANTKDGNRPSFIDAMEPEQAKTLYNYFIKKLEEASVDVRTGSFGNFMTIDAQLDGPTTIILES